MSFFSRIFSPDDALLVGHTRERLAKRGNEVWRKKAQKKHQKIFLK